LEGPKREGLKKNYHQGKKVCFLDKLF